MQYFSIYSPNLKTNGAQQTPEQRAAMDKFVGEAIARGEFVSGGAFSSLVSKGAVVRRSDGKATVIDGPYVESKEIIGGFALLNYVSREAAIEGAKRFLDVAGDGECVTYQLTEQHDC